MCHHDVFIKCFAGTGEHRDRDLRQPGGCGKMVQHTAIQRLIPGPSDRDSRRRFTNRRGYDSPWQTRGGLSWRLRLAFGRITTRRDCASWPSGRLMPLRPGACWRWRRSMPAALAARPPRSAVSDCKRCGTGCWRSMPRDRRAWSTARRRAIPAAQQRAPRGVAADRRERPDRGGSRRRALAAG